MTGVRVVAVGDNDVNPIGLTAVLAAHPGIEVETGRRHFETASGAE